MTGTADTLSIRACRLEDTDGVLELWRQAGATPGVTDTPDDLRRAIAAWGCLQVRLDADDAGARWPDLRNRAT